MWENFDQKKNFVGKLENFRRQKFHDIKMIFVFFNKTNFENAKISFFMNGPSIETRHVKEVINHCQNNLPLFAGLPEYNESFLSLLSKIFSRHGSLIKSSTFELCTPASNI